MSQSSSLCLGTQADVANEGLVNLTSASASQFGSAQSQIQIDLASDFSISSRILLGSDDGGADGIVFVLHNDPAGDTANGSAIQNGFAVEFDTFDNSIDGSDENGLVGGADHISIFDTDAGSAGFYRLLWQCLSAIWKTGISMTFY